MSLITGVIFITLISLVYPSQLLSSTDISNPVQCIGEIAPKKILPSPTSMHPISRQGYVKAEGRKLILDGKTFQTIGVNRYNLLSTPEHRCGGTFSDTELDTWFHEVSDMGAKLVRLWLFPLLTDSGNDLRRFDRIIDLANQYDVKLIPVFENHWADCTSGGTKDKGWYATSSQINPNANLSYQAYVTKIVNLYKDEPAIGIWQLMNEAESDSQTLFEFARRMAGAIKAVDSNHLVSLGIMGGGQPGAQEVQYLRLHQLTDIDVLTYHDYNHIREALPGDHWNGLAVRLSQAAIANKPLLITESGIESNCIDFPCVSPSERIDLFSNKITSFFNAGGASYLVWSYRDTSNAPIHSFDFTSQDPLYDELKSQNIRLQSNL